MNIETDNLVVVLLAGGKGKRLNKKTSKQMLKYDEITILEKNIVFFKKILKKTPIQIISNIDDLPQVDKICKKYNTLPPVSGGKKRHESVCKALETIKYINPKYVLIHDSARPLISTKVIENLIKYCSKDIICVVPTLKINDAIRSVSNNLVINMIDKKDKVLIQTPQLSNYKLLIYTLKNSKFSYEDESSLFISNSMKVIAIEGDPLTLKITYQRDLKLLEPHLSNYKSKYITKVGNGFDVHRFDIKKKNNKNFIKLGGITINNINPLIGHSDGDVLLHAITDSILGIINKGDIGKLFPTSEKKWENIDSSIFLKHASKMLEKEKGIINNIDTVIICEKPNILRYNEKITENIARILNINPRRISVKGKSSESVGFVGRREGIAAMAITSVQIPDEFFDD